MFEANVKVAGGKILIKVEAESQKELFRQIAQAQDIFDIEMKCGACGSLDIHFQVRSIKGNDFFELVCPKCNAQFKFGQHKVGGTLYPKSDEGWVVWKKGDDDGYRGEY
jgi:hypothetical protein